MYREVYPKYLLQEVESFPFFGLREVVTMAEKRLTGTNLGSRHTRLLSFELSSFWLSFSSFYVMTHGFRIISFGLGDLELCLLGHSHPALAAVVFSIVVGAQTLRKKVSAPCHDGVHLEKALPPPPFSFVTNYLPKLCHR